MTHSLNRSTTIVLLIMLILALFMRLDRPGLRAEEPRRAMVALETFEIQPIGIPKINGRPYVNKPPLYIWLQGMFLRAFGSSSESFVRLPGMIFFLLTAFILYHFVAQFFNKPMALHSALFYLLSADLWFYASVYSGEMDFFYAFLVVFQLFGIWSLLEKQRHWMLFLCLYGLSMAGLLTKGLPSLHFHASFILLIWWRSRNWRLFFRPAHLISLVLSVLFLLFIFRWYNQFADAKLYALSLIGESIEKSAVSYHARDIFKHLLAFPFVFFSLLMPWALIPILNRVPAIRNWPPLISYLLLFVVLNIWIYWLSPGNHNRYLYMFFPPIGIMLAYVYLNGSKRTFVKKLFPLIYLPAIVGLVLPWALYLNSKVQMTIAIPIFFSLMFVSWFLFRKKMPSTVLQIALCMLMLRFAMNEMYLPLVQEQTETGRYLGHVEVIKDLAQGETIYLYGPLSQENLKFRIESVIDVQAIKTSPPLIPYQIPYYYHQQSGQFLLYNETPKTGSLCLCHRSALPASITENQILYAFADEWNKQEMVLFRY